jgi:hypothetical protein
MTTRMDEESSTPQPPGQAASGRRRTASLLLVAVVVTVAGWLALRRPVECDLSIAFGARAADVRAVRVVLREGDRASDGRLVRTISLQLPSGATGPIARAVRLRPGSYRAEVIVTDAAARERTVRRTLTVERDECALLLDLGD